MIEEIINKTIEILKSSVFLDDVREWHCINGLVPSKYRTISIGCEDMKFTDYTQDQDECNAVLKIYASLDNRELSSNGRKKEEDRLEYGERAIQGLAENIRLVLVENYTLDGIVDVSNVEGIEFTTSDDCVDLHIAIISLGVKFYAERSRTIKKPLTVKEIYMQMNDEEMHFGEKGED